MPKKKDSCAKCPTYASPGERSASHALVSMAPAAGGVIGCIFEDKPWADVVRVKASAMARWKAAPDDEKRRIRDSLHGGSSKFERRLRELEEMNHAPLTNEEMGLALAYRYGGHSGVKAWLKAHGEQNRRVAKADDLDDFLITGWYADKGFSLCWLSKVALLKALVAWEYLKESNDQDSAIDCLKKRLQRNGLCGLLEPVVDIRNLKIRSVGKRSVVEIS